MRNGNGHVRADLTPAIGIEYQVMVKGDKPEPLITFQTGIARECPQEDLDRLLDKIRAAIFRQKKLSELEGAETDMANWGKQMSDTIIERDHFLAAHEEKRKRHKDQGGRAEFGMNEGEKDRLAGYERDIARLTDQIKAKEKRAEVLRAECR